MCKDVTAVACGIKGQGVELSVGVLMEGFASEIWRDRFLVAFAVHFSLPISFCSENLCDADPFFVPALPQTQQCLPPHGRSGGEVPAVWRRDQGHPGIGFRASESTS